MVSFDADRFFWLRLVIITAVVSTIVVAVVSTVVIPTVVIIVLIIVIAVVVPVICGTRPPIIFLNGPTPKLKNRDAPVSVVIDPSKQTIRTVSTESCDEFIERQHAI